MKRLIGWLFVGFLLLAPLGCKTSSKRVLVATITTVRQSMLAWRDWVAAGKASPEDEARVKDAYLKYQMAVRVAKRVLTEADANPDSQVDTKTVVNLVAKGSDEVVNTVTRLISKPVTQ